MIRPVWSAVVLGAAILLSACSGDTNVDAAGPPVDDPAAPAADHVEVVVDLDAESAIVFNPFDETVSFSPYPELERRTDGQWSLVSDESVDDPQPVLPTLQLIQPRSQSSVRVPRLGSLEPGTYRLRVTFGIGNEPPDESVETEFIVE